MFHQLYEDRPPPPTTVGPVLQRSGRSDTSRRSCSSVPRLRIYMNTPYHCSLSEFGQKESFAVQSSTIFHVQRAEQRGSFIVRVQERSNPNFTSPFGFGVLNVNPKCKTFVDFSSKRKPCLFCSEGFDHLIPIRITISYDGKQWRSSCDFEKEK